MRGKNIFATRWGIIGVGAAIGILAAVLQKLGNPGNMGICVACFERDIAGALGLQRAAVVQYIRPEIIGFVFGSLIAAFIFREFRPRVGSAPIVRFVLGAFAMIGALVFLGCPWRAANMKITIAKEGLKIVNISGGGCPDVPFLARQMVGKTLAEAPRPRDLGHTLCGYALELAYEELRRTC